MIDGALPILDVAEPAPTATSPTEDPTTAGVFASLVAQLMLGAGAQPPTPTGEPESSGDPAVEPAGATASATVTAELTIGLPAIQIDARRLVGAGTEATAEMAAAVEAQATAVAETAVEAQTTVIAEADSAVQTATDVPAGVDVQAGARVTTTLDASVEATVEATIAATAQTEDPEPTPAPAEDAAPAEPGPAAPAPPEPTEPSPPGPTPTTHAEASASAGTADGDPSVDDDEIDVELDLSAAVEVSATTGQATEAPAPATQPEPTPALLVPNGRPTTVQAAASAPVDASTSTAARYESVELPVSGQIAARIGELHLDADGRHELTLDLHPAELGSVAVDVVVDARTVHVAIRAEHAPAAELLRSSLDELRQALAESGLDIGDLTTRDPGTSRQGQTDDRPGARPGASGRIAAHADPTTTVAGTRSSASADVGVDVLL